MIVTLIAFVIFIFCGWIRPSNLVLLLIWTQPYIAGNALFGWVPPFEFQPSIPLGFAIIAIAIFKQRLFTKNSFSSTIYLLLFYLLITTITISLVYKFQFLHVWNQPPLVRGIRSYLNEVFFWLTPLAALNLGWHEKKIDRYGKAFIYAGFFYCGLGILQFIVSLSLKIDIFSVTRRGVTVVLQPLALGGFSGRITSICGEPRYLAAYAVFWFTLLLCTGKYFGCKTRTQVLGCFLFVLTALLSGSRTAIISLALVMLIICVCQAAGLGKFLDIKQISLLFLLGISTAFMKLLFWNHHSKAEEFSIVTRLGKHTTSQAVLNLGLIRVPLEYQDLEALKVVWKAPWMLITGSGTGLWQYGFDPFTIEYVRETYKAVGINAIDSVQSNIGLIHNIVNYGAIGLFIIALVYFNFFRLCVRGASQQDRKHLLGFILIFLVFAQFIRASSGFYAQLALVLLVCSIRAQMFNKQYFSTHIDNDNSTVYTSPAP